MEIEYKYIPQQQYLIDNIPAGKYGEWPGIKPNHWHGSIRIIHPFQSGKVFDDRDNKPEKNRKHFESKYGFEEPYKPQKRLFSAANICLKLEDKKTGLRPINFQPIPVKENHDKKHFDPKFGFERIPYFMGLKTFYPNGQCRSELETPLEVEMGQKKRIWTTHQQRNGMKMRVPGDKFYRKAEEFPTYYKEGGLIPGSTNRLNFNKTQSRQAYNFYETLDLSKPTLDRKKIWKNKVKQEELDSDKKYVGKAIGEWEKNILNDFEPNYLKKKVEEEVPDYKRPPPRNARGQNAKGKGAQKGKGKK